MIDSILLKIPVTNYQNIEAFTKKRVNADHSIPRVIRLSTEITNKMKKQGIYVPQITFETQNRGFEQKYICIQVSLPKLLYNASLFEVKEEDFNTVVDVIQKYLGENGIYLRKEKIINGFICRIDFAKVIQLPKLYTNAADFIEKLYKSGFRSRSDLTQRDVRHGKDGYWIKFYSRTSSVTFYDKMAEIEAQGYTSAEKDLIKLLKQNRLSKHVLKYEVALQNKQKVTQLINKVTGQELKSYTLQEVFKEEIAKKVLLYYLNASFNHEVDFLCQFDEQELRTQIRNKYGYKKAGVYLYFVLREIEERGSQIVLDEIKLLHGYSYYRTVLKNLSELRKHLDKATKEKVMPVEFLKSCLDQFTIYKPNLNHHG